MGQEFFINSQELESKVRQLLPSQGGAGAGFDLSASTQIVPIIDLTESAEGSNIRQDLQTALSHASVTSFNVTNTTTSIVINTGYFRCFGVYSCEEGNATSTVDTFSLGDGSTDKIIWSAKKYGSNGATKNLLTYDFLVFLEAGDNLKATTGSPLSFLSGCTRQIASIDGTLVNP